ncbi:unnamed protein product [Closterium sp. NIES-53]
MDRELAALEKRGTWDLIPIEKTVNKNILTGKWVFRVKTKADGTYEKHKARWVVRGFDQTHGIDYTLTFPPVSRHTSVRLVLCEAAANNFPLRQIDVSNAFFYADIDAEIYVEYPHTYSTNPPSVCKLKKSLYGIKQAPLLWQQHLNKKLTEVGFRQQPHDPGMYRLDDKGSYALLVAYVDDILHVSSSTSLGDCIEADLKKSLNLTISTKVTQFLGLNISRTSSAIHLTASKYAESLAKRFNISTDFVATPYRSTLTGHVPDLKKLSAAGLQLYLQQLGCLLFAAATCRPDLAYVACHLAQFLCCPKEEHSLDLQRALRYFVSTPTLGLIFNAGKPTDKMYLSGYVDADHAGDTSDRRSRTGYIFRLEPIGLISWNSSKQELVSLSLAEAEFIAACAATREGLYLQELLDEAKFVTPNQFTLQCDNQSAITIANKPGSVNRTKHISLRYFFVKDTIDKGRMRLVYCPTSDMAADSLTKKLTHAVEPDEVAVDSGAARGAEPVGAGSGGAEPGGAESGGAESGGAEPGGAEPGGAEPGGAEPGDSESARVASRSPSSRRELPSPQELREWFAWRWSRAAGAGGPPVAPGPGGARTGGTGAVGTGGAAAATGGGAAGASGAAGAGATGGVGAGVGSAGGTARAAGGTGAAGPAGVGAVGAEGAAGAGAAPCGTGAVPVGSGGPSRPRPYFVPLLEQSQLQPVSPLPAPSPYAGPTGDLAERREPASHPASPVRITRTSHCAPRPRPPAVPGTHQMTLRPSTAPLRVPLPSPPESSLLVLADPASDYLRAASPTVARFLATVVTDPSLASSAASALVAELVDFAARCRLDYAASLVAESVSVCAPSVRGECALSTDVLEDKQEEFQCFAAALPHLVSTLLTPEGDPDAPDIPTPRSYAEAIEGPYSPQWQSAMDVEMASWKSTGTYVDEVPPPGANIGVDYFQASTLRVLLHVAAQRNYELHSLDFSTAFVQGSLHEEIWLRRPPGFTGSFPPGTQWSLRRPIYGLRQAPREWHDTLRTTLAALGFAPSTADPSLFLRTDTSLPPFYILVYVDDLVFAIAETAGLAHVKSELQKRHTCTDLGELRSYLGLQITQDRAQRTITLTQSHMVQQVLQRFDFTYSLPQATPLSTRHSLSALPSDESVEPSGPYPELVGCLMYLMTYTRSDLAYPLSILARYVAPGRHRPEHMAAAKRVLRYLCNTSGLGLVLGGRRPVVLTGHADASWADDQATQRSSQCYIFSLGSGSVSWRSTRSSSVLGSSCEAEIYAGAMAAQELRWLTYLLADLGEPPRSPPVLYVDNKAMLALCREHRLEHRTKHIALRYFLARELQQRGQLRLAYVASEANTADIFTKALQPGDRQRFCTMLACFALLDWSCDPLFSPTLPMGRANEEEERLWRERRWEATTKAAEARATGVGAHSGYQSKGSDYRSNWLRG